MTLAVESWSAPLAERERILLRFAAVLEDRKAELAALIHEEVHKPHWEAAQEVSACVAKIELTIAALHERRDTTILPNGRITYAPLGTVLVLGPFNFPAHLPNGQIAPALLAGNGVIFKPSEHAPKVGAFYVHCWRDAGLPAQCLRLVQGGGEVVQALLRQPDLAGVFFTGSHATARHIAAALADRPHIVTMFELGGHNPMLVWKPDDMEAAVQTAAFSAFVTAGQRCTCARRLILPDALADEFIDRLVATAKRLSIGPDGFMGPLINAAAADRLIEVQRLLGGTRHLEAVADGPAVTPGIVELPPRRFEEEWFGPLLVVQRVADMWEHGPSIANDTPFGLSAAVLSGSRDFYDHCRQALRAGIINWNAPTVGAAGRMPFGGHGFSGNGRPAGFFAIDACNVPVASLENASITPPDLRLPSDA